MRILTLTSVEAWLMTEEQETGIVYECIKCGAKVATKDLEIRGGAVKCTYCGYRVLKKMRSPVVKRVRTR